MGRGQGDREICRGFSFKEIEIKSIRKICIACSCFVPYSGGEMGFLDEDRRAALQIDRMVFHLVGPTNEHLQLLEEIEPGDFEAFFLDLIRGVEGGNLYSFSDASSTRARLMRIVANPDQFQRESEQLAADFQRQHGGSTAPGAFLVFVLSVGEEKVFALLKYDDEQVLAYEVEELPGGRKRVTLDQIERTFVQNKNALQKAALIQLTEDGGELLVLDRLNPQKVARYFENFLDAIRVFGDSELTKRLVSATRETILNNRQHVPPEVLKNLNQRLYDAASGGGRVEAEGTGREFLETVLGRRVANDNPLLPKLKSKIRKARIDGAGFDLDPQQVDRPRTRRIVTRNGITIRVANEFRNLVREEGQRIVIDDMFQAEFDDTERVRGRD